MSIAPDHAKKVAHSLLSELSEDAKLLLDQNDDKFKESMRRWSDVDVKIPAAIFKPGSEDDVVKIVQSAILQNIPIVAKGGGQSLWSTTSGWIIDFSLLKAIKLDAHNKTVTVQPGVTTKELNVAVAEERLCTPFAGVSAVGYIPYLLGGGLSWMTGIHGLAVDNLISANIVTATRGLVTASATQNEELFWALKGAGQFFGIVTEVTVRVFPLEEQIVSWVTVFAASQVKEVARVLEQIVNGPDAARSTGMAAIMVAPGQTDPMILIKTMHFRPEADAKRVVEPILALKPIRQIQQIVDYATITDAADQMFTEGGLKTQISCGLQRFDAGKFEQSLVAFTALVEKHPGAARSFIFTNWFADVAGGIPGGNSAYAHRDCTVWSMCFMDATDETAARATVATAEEYVSICQADQKESEKASFPNHTRAKSLEHRYRGGDRLEKLRRLKSLWDPEGVFTDQLLT